MGGRHRGHDADLLPPGASVGYHRDRVGWRSQGGCGGKAGVDRCEATAGTLCRASAVGPAHA
eukprot:11207559-Alexandrium_andersonii.AAC.1